VSEFSQSHSAQPESNFTVALDHFALVSGRERALDQVLGSEAQCQM
jgi:hypothetical protein